VHARLDERIGGQPAGVAGVALSAGGQCRGVHPSDTLKKAAHAVGAHRISTRPSTRRVRVEAGGEVLADSVRAVELDESGLPTRWYLPREDVRTDLLTASTTTSHCPFKGDATYLSAPGVKDAFWVYDDPSEPDARPIAGMLAPWPGRVDVFVDDEPV
jgi:uncharacterized protein (DUF427 family)